MAGIGFALRKLVRRDDLLGVMSGYSISTLLSSGPWLFTIICLAGINLFLSNWVDPNTITTFRIILIYNFAFSLVLSGPIILMTTRFVADSIYLRNLNGVPTLLLITLGLVFLVGLCIMVPFYVWFTDFESTIKMVAIVNYWLISGVWVITIFVTAIKNYTLYTWMFGVGMLIAFIASTLLGPIYGAAGMVVGFSLGLVLIMFAIIARVFVEYPATITLQLGNYFSYYPRYWELFVSGLVFNAAIWVDKWVMWLSPGHEVVSGLMMYHPNYDGAMFLAYLALIPSMAYFMVTAETGLLEKYYTYFNDIKHHATYQKIEHNHQALAKYITRSFRRTIILQATVSAIALLWAPQIVTLLGGKYIQLSIFRMGILGTFFHSLIIFISTLLAYFDLRKMNLLVHTLLLTLNGLFAYISVQLGFAFYGYGYFIACFLTFLVAFGMIIYVLKHLPYFTFIKNNQSSS